MTRVAERLRWYKNRLAAMSAAEIAWRIEETLKRKFDRFYADRLIAPVRDVGTLPEIPSLRANLEAWNVPETLLTQWREDARRAQTGRFHMFGQEWPRSAYGDAWHLDPITREMWPRDVFCFAINYRHNDNGDIKYVWELNRLQYLQPVAALAFKTKDAELARFCLNEIESWIDNNPPFLGVNWNSGIELALRIVSILTVTTLVGEHLSRETRGKIWATLHTHARWIARYPSRYSSANNHRTAEGLGLFIVGALCPHFAESAQWRQTGWDILCDAAEKQILPDGAGAEQAVAYLASVLETLLTGLVVARAHAIPVPDHYLRKITLGGDYLRWLCDADGNAPQIGDDDNACVFGEYHTGDRYAASVTSCIAAITNRADLVAPKTETHLRHALFGHPPAPDFAPYGTRCFDHGGMTIGRHKTVAGDVLLAFDHGPLGYLSIAAHGHADTLALWLHVGNQPVFVDAGTFLYHAPGDDRRYFRGTAAHNTLQLEDTDSSLISGAFNWSRKASATLRLFAPRGDFWQAEAEQNGYLDAFHCLHRRALSVSSASGCAVEDTLTGNAPHHVAISFLLHPALTARREGKEISIMKGEKLIVRLRHESGLETIIAATGTPENGWYSPEFGVKQPTTRITFKGVLVPGHKAVTHIFWAF